MKLRGKETLVSQSFLILKTQLLFVSWLSLALLCLLIYVMVCYKLYVPVFFCGLS